MPDMRCMKFSATRSPVSSVRPGPRTVPNTWRASTRSPEIVPAPPAWQERVAKLAHVALYALMITLPMLGWLALSAEGRPITLAGVPLPMPIGPDKEWVKPLEKIHEIVGQAGYALVGLHAAAALWHHHVMRDNTLALMWPFAKSR